MELKVLTGQEIHYYCSVSKLLNQRVEKYALIWYGQVISVNGTKLMIKVYVSYYEAQGDS